jgi:hypothetical protein
MHASTVFIFSKRPDTLAEVGEKLEQLGYQHTWLSAQSWPQHISELWKATGIIVDVVDREFEEAALEGLLPWLLQVGYLPARLLLLVDMDDHRFDDQEHFDPRVRIHRFKEILTDDELRELMQESQVALDLVA